MGLLTRTLALCLLASATATLAQVEPNLHPYTVCTFDDGLAVTDLSPLPQGVQGRTVDTLTGKVHVALLSGERVMFSYPNTDFFANVKVEELPPNTFAQGSKALISNFDHILVSGDDSTRNMTFALHPTLNGFEVHGLDSKQLEGQTLGIYLLVDRRTHIIATVYFLNQNPGFRKFSTLDEYAALRDHFLDAYTACIHPPRKGTRQLAVTPPPPLPSVITAPAPTPPALVDAPGFPAPSVLAPSPVAPSPVPPRVVAAPAETTPPATATPPAEPEAKNRHPAFASHGEAGVTLRGDKAKIQTSRKGRRTSSQGQAAASFSK